MANPTLDEAFAAAHLPSLAVTLAQLSGDDALLKLTRPVYDFFGDGQGALTDTDRAAIHTAAHAILPAILDGSRPPAGRPDPARLAQMMDWIAGVDIPPDYAPLMSEELRFEGEDNRAPELLPASVRRSAVIVGAGMSGLLAAYRLTQMGVDVTVIEKNADVGGTWLENTYPGVRVDTQNHLYSYSFEPNHGWPQHYSTGDVLLNYFRSFADKHDLRRLIRFGTKVTEARWDEAASRWRVALDTGETRAVDILVSAVGQLNTPRLPAITGRDSFAGPAFHSARWDHGVALDGKRVGVIGTGASAFQFVPEIAGRVAHLDVFQRSAPWLGPTPDYHDAVTPAKSWLLEHVPYYAQWYRFWLFWMLTDGLIPAITAEDGWNGPPGTIGALNAELRDALAGATHAQLTAKPHLGAHVVPDYAPGGKRSLRDNGVWLAALQRDNCELVTDPIAAIEPAGVRMADGSLREQDVLIWGTGFHASDFLASFRVTGRDGRDLHQQWAGDARAYLGLTVPGFPNFFMLYGPNTNIVVNGSIIFFSECAVRYLTGAVRLMADSGARAMEVRGEVHDAFNTRVDAENARMAWGQPGVSSWYKNASGRVSQNWPFKLVDYWRATLTPDPADFHLTPFRPERMAAE